MPPTVARKCVMALVSLLLPLLPAHAQQPFTLKQVLSAPYATSLSASPVGARFAWVEDAEGVHNLWVGGPNEPAQKLTHNTEDDAQDISGLDWSPDGTAIAYTYGAPSGSSGRPANPAHLQRNTAVHILIQPLDTKLPALDLGEGRSPLYTRDGHRILFLRSGQIWIADSETAKDAHLLVYDRGTPSSLTLSPDGKLLAYISRRRSGNGGQPHSFVALFDLSTKTLRFLSPSTGVDSAPAFSPDGKQIAWLRAPFTQDDEFVNSRVTPNPWSIQLADIATGTGNGTAHTVFQPEPNKPGSVAPRMSTGEPKLFWTATTHSAPAKPALKGTGFSPSIDKPATTPALAAEGQPSPASLIFASEADGWVHLYSLDPTTNMAPKLLTPGSFEVEDANLSRDGRVLFWSSSAITGSDAKDADRRHIWQLNLADPGSAPKWRDSGAEIATHPTVAADGSLLAALVSDDHPMHPVLIGPSGIITPLLPPASPATLTLPQQALFAASDDIALHAQLFEPRTPKPTKHPAIIFVHGGPKRQMLLGYPSMDYYSNAYAMNQYLASRGFIVLSVNYRSGIGYGLDFRQSEHQGANGAAEYNDVLAAQKYLASRPDVDVKRIGIWGGSYGGYLTALALARNSDLFAAGVDFHGVHEWAVEDNAPADWLHGPPDDPTIPAALAAKAHASSPMADIDKWRSPILLIHGDDDPEVTYTQTPLLADALRARKLPVEELVFPDEVHGFLLHKDWLAAYEATAAFFERTLQP